MSESSMVCNGHKENNIEKYPVSSVNELYPLEKSLTESSSIAGHSSKDSMTIGALSFPAFDHLYATSVDETGEQLALNMNIARTNLSSYHLNIIEEQAKIIDTQSHEISKLKKQNESLIARIERINRRLSLNQCGKNVNSCREKRSFFNDEVHRIKDEALDETENLNGRETQDDSFPDDVPLIRLTPRDDHTDIVKSNSTCENSGLELSKHLAKDNTQSAVNESDPQSFNNQNAKFNFWIKFRRNNAAFMNQRPKRNKMVRFVEEKPDNSSHNILKKPKRNCAKTIDEKLKKDDAVFFFKTLPDKPVTEPSSEPNKVEDTDADDAHGAKKKRTLKIPILTTSETYFTSVKEDTSHLYGPITYTPTALEVPSFKIIEKDNIDSSDVPKDYFEDVTIEAAKERHLRFEVDERKRKKWDVQRIHELRRNERLKERLRRRKSRWNKMESPQQQKTEISDLITSLFPNIRTIEKIIITDAVPVTALGTSIPKIPSWGCNFKTDWKNDGNADSKTYEDNQHIHHHHHQHHRHHHHPNKESRSKPA